MTTTAPAAYWEPLWADGRRYRALEGAEADFLTECLGPGRGRPALDIGCGDGGPARHLHHRLGYRVTGIDCAPSALAAARRADPGAGQGPGPAWLLMDFGADDLGRLPEPAYAAVTCRLVYRWVDDKRAFLDRVRRVLAPGGVFWVVAELAGRREPGDPLADLAITTAEEEALTAGWSSVRTADVDVLRCYALRP
ncbi:class I SAM-dependent methyltransferase [Streptomyces sp. NPDC090077]|uniref:class I SAM-dependent methyltransferase n=1 Tax=Streptomyces sp. NPDC090077 TaxID=3365938 RepID=UPI003815A2E5